MTPTLPQMMKKLEEMQDEQAYIITATKELQSRYEQLNDDIEMLEVMIMYKSNQEARKNVV
jgi:predicted nuclease with TOPRIM domain